MTHEYLNSILKLSPKRLALGAISSNILSKETWRICVAQRRLSWPYWGGFSTRQDLDRLPRSFFFSHQNSFWVSPLHDQHRRDIRPLVTLVWILFFCTYFRLASRTFTQHLPCHNTKRISAHVDVISKLISSCHLLQLEWNLLFSGRAIGPRLFFLRKVR